MKAAPQPREVEGQGYIAFVETFREDVQCPESCSPSVVGLLGKWRGVGSLGSLEVEVKGCDSQTQAVALTLQQLAHALVKRGVDVAGEAAA